MQRLFSTFPTGRPGIGLLLFRFVLAWMLLTHFPALAAMLGQPLATIACIGVAGLLALGVFTPLTGAAGVFLAGACLASAQHALAADLMLMLFMLSLALLGPGAYSIDARLFGRREVVLTRKTGSRTE